jgi:hypothetical protein
VTPVWAFAFYVGGRPMAGWPVELPCCFIGRVIGDTLTVYGREYRNNSVDGWIVSVAADGTVRDGERVTYSNCCPEVWDVGPDGVAYGIVHHFGDSPEAPKSSDFLAVGFAGAPAGFPVAIDGIASEPAFDAAGRIHVTVLPLDGPSRTLVFGPDGRAVVGGSGELEIRASDDCVGIEGSCEVPAAPLLGADGTTFVIGTDWGPPAVLVAVAISSSGQIMGGWPYRSDAWLQATGFYHPGDSDPFSNLAAPAVGTDSTLYLPLQARDATVGGSIVAVGPDGQVRPGWPVELRRPGAEFWSVVVGSDGTVYALAIEPETGDASSASILAIAPDSTVLWTTTIVDP